MLHRRVCTRVRVAKKLAALGLATFILLSETAVMSQSAHAAESSVEAGEDQSGDERYRRGLQRLDEITRGDGKTVVDALSRISPDFARYVVEYP